jgi:enoyl-CoA hydratase/carnithine racemase
MVIHLTRIDELALVRLDRPEVLNALNAKLLRDLGAALPPISRPSAKPAH